MPTRAEVRTLIRRRCDLENTTDQVDAEIDIHINDSARVLHDLLIAIAGPIYNRVKGSFTTVAGTAAYALASIPDFYKPIRVSIPYNGRDYPLGSYSEEGDIKETLSSPWAPGCWPRYCLAFDKDSTLGIEFDKPADMVRTVNLAYHSLAPTYATDGANVTIPFVDYLVMEACVRVKDKEERERSHFERERESIKERITNWGATFDQASAWGTIDVSHQQRRSWRRFP